MVWDLVMVLVGHCIEGQVLVSDCIYSTVDYTMVGSFSRNPRRAGRTTVFSITIVFPSSALAGECISHLNRPGFRFNIRLDCHMHILCMEPRTCAHWISGVWC
ncbi:hypothetical protein B0H12DRAFT_1102895 [Mycena haematopus]|nr:hypothetical protein B0H12DRAFT_1102895 [Mycena haematopus]